VKNVVYREGCKKWSFSQSGGCGQTDQTGKLLVEKNGEVQRKGRGELKDYTSKK
jgi:hypothetical protein